MTKCGLCESYLAVRFQPVQLTYRRPEGRFITFVLVPTCAVCDGVLTSYGGG